MRRSTKLEARCGFDGFYDVHDPGEVRDPVDWWVIAWIGIVVAVLVMPFAGSVRWLTG